MNPVVKYLYEAFLVYQSMDNVIKNKDALSYFKITNQRDNIEKFKDWYALYDHMEILK